MRRHFSKMPPPPWPYTRVEDEPDGHGGFRRMLRCDACTEATGHDVVIASLGVGYHHQGNAHWANLETVNRRRLNT